MTVGIAVVIPCYNEERMIADIVARASRYVDRVIVADDASMDGTCDIAKESGAMIVRSDKRCGFGGNVMMGLNQAMAEGYEIIATLDGDGQHNPDEIPKVIQLVQSGEADLVIGSRFLRPFKAPRYRKFGIDVITWLYNLGYQEKITDGQSCFRAYSRYLLENIGIQDSGFGFSTEILIKTRRLGYRIREVPISCIYHKELRLNSTMNPVRQGVSVALATIMWRLRGK